MLSDIIDALPLPALIVGANERIVAINELATNLLGPGAVGRHYITIVRQPAVLDVIEDCLRTGAGGSAKFLTTEARRDQAWATTVASVAPQKDVLVTFEDQSIAEDAVAQRRDFIANVSHELRTPLTALLGFIETLQGAAKNDPVAQERFLSIMQREATRMNRLVDDLLSLNKVEAQGRIRPIEKVDLVQQALSVTHALENLADERSVGITTAGMSEPTFVHGDDDQLSQIVTNLLENAIKYSGEGTNVIVSIESIEDHPLLRGPAKVLTVEDSGPGIDPVHIPRLTERFYRVDSHRSRLEGGTGLGLAIVKHIVNRHRGRLQISSELGKGTKFQVVLPSFETDT